MEKQNPSPPYVTFKSFETAIDKLTEHGTPDVIDRSLFQNASGSHISAVMQGLKFMELIDEHGTPTENLVKIRSDSDSRLETWKTLFSRSYSGILQTNTNLQTCTRSQFEELFRSAYGIRGSTVTRAAAFFIILADLVGFELSDYAKKQKSSSTNPRPARKRAKSDQAHSTPNMAVMSAPSTSYSSDDLDHILIEEMRNGEMESQEIEAAFVLIRYFTAKKGKGRT